MSDSNYYLLHLDIYCQGKCLTDAMAALKHHPCTLGELYSCADAHGFDRKTAKLIATKKHITITRHDIEDRKKKELKWSDSVEK